MQNVIAVINNVGFPIAVCVILLIRGDKALKEMTSAINELRVLIAGKCK